MGFKNKSRGTFHASNTEEEKKEAPNLKFPEDSSLEKCNGRQNPAKARNDSSKIDISQLNKLLKVKYVTKQLISIASIARKASIAYAGRRDYKPLSDLFCDGF